MNEANTHEFVNLNVDELLMLHISIGWHLGNFKRFLGECIDMVSKEGDERKFLFSTKIPTNVYHLGRYLTNLHKFGGDSVRSRRAQSFSRVVGARLARSRGYWAPNGFSRHYGYNFKTLRRDYILVIYNGMGLLNCY